MAKGVPKIEYSKEKFFDELLQKSWYYKKVYTYLLKFENEFTNLSLMDFIINCEAATGNVLMALLNQNNNKDLTIKYIIEQKGYYETSIKPDYDTGYLLNDFELYLTKFIVAHCLIIAYNEDTKRADYFNRVWNITARQKDTFNPIVNYFKETLMETTGMGSVFNEWQLEYQREQQATTQPTVPQKKIQPIKWQKQSVLLAYLINELKTYGFIDEDGIWAICEQVFVDKKGDHIKAENFTSMVKNYENNQTPDGTKGKPKANTEITELIKKLKAISKEIE